MIGGLHTPRAIVQLCLIVAIVALGIGVRTGDRQVVAQKAGAARVRLDTSRRPVDQATSPCPESRSSPERTWRSECVGPPALTSHGRLNATNSPGCFLPEIATTMYCLPSNI
jgi:hypothetical protein